MKKLLTLSILFVFIIACNEEDNSDTCKLPHSEDENIVEQAEENIKEKEEQRVLDIDLSDHTSIGSDWSIQLYIVKGAAPYELFLSESLENYKYTVDLWPYLRGGSYLNNSHIKIMVKDVHSFNTGPGYGYLGELDFSNGDKIILGGSDFKMEVKPGLVFEIGDYVIPEDTEKQHTLINWYFMVPNEIVIDSNNSFKPNKAVFHCGKNYFQYDEDYNITGVDDEINPYILPGTYDVMCYLDIMQNAQVGPATNHDVIIGFIEDIVISEDLTDESEPIRISAEYDYSGIDPYLR